MTQVFERQLVESDRFRPTTNASGTKHDRRSNDSSKVPLMLVADETRAEHQVILEVSDPEQSPRTDCANSNVASKALLQYPDLIATNTGDGNGEHH